MYIYTLASKSGSPTYIHISTLYKIHSFLFLLSLDFQKRKRLKDHGQTYTVYLPRLSSIYIHKLLENKGKKGVKDTLVMAALLDAWMLPTIFR